MIAPSAVVLNSETMKKNVSFGDVSKVVYDEIEQLSPVYSPPSFSDDDDDDDDNASVSMMLEAAETKRRLLRRTTAHMGKQLQLSSCSPLHSSILMRRAWANMVAASLPEVCLRSGAVYAVFWGVDRGRDILHAICHYNPETRIQQVKQASGACALYTTESYQFRFRPGQGLIGKAFANREPMLMNDVTDLPDDAFMRKRVAQRFGIRSIAVTPYNGGILEVGTTDEWEKFDWHIAIANTLDALQAA